MMKSILGSGLINNIAKSSLNKSVLRPSYTPIRFNSNNANLDQLKAYSINQMKNQLLPMIHKLNQL